MAKPSLHLKPSRENHSFFVAIAAVVIILCTAWTFLVGPFHSFSKIISLQKSSRIKDCPNVTDHSSSSYAAKQGQDQDPPEKTFYDDPEIHYTIDKPIRGWDEKRHDWLKQHSATLSNVPNRMLIVTGTQHAPCRNPEGDYIQLRFFKNKVDYSRIHGYDIFYNNLLLHPKMNSFWAKIPILRAAMLAHPEAEWILWVDSDAIFTDMDFKIPFERYKDYNLIIHGWPDMIEKRSWVSVNAGIILMRNCQWSMQFLDKWAVMSPISPDYDKWAQILKQTLPDKMFHNSDDQSALIYLLLKEKAEWRKKVNVENTYDLHGYWLPIVDRFEEFARRYEEIEREHKKLRRRHAEVVSGAYAAAQGQFLKEGRRPFITHFTGCQPCSGEHNAEYKGDSCRVGMERALNFADNQVLRVYGYGHPDLRNGSYVRPLPFDYPSR